MRPASRAALACAIVATALLPPAHAQERGTTIAQRGGGRRGGGSAAADVSLGRVLTQGTVQSADSATGRVEVKIEGGVIDATFPPNILAQTKAGDAAFVVVDLIDPRVATMTATVSALDPAHGTVALATSRGTLTLKPSAEALARMKVGDPLLLKLELIDIGKSLDEKTN